MIREVVIIGGGFGGVGVAKSLTKHVKNVHITLIDKNKYHTFYPSLYEVATAHIPELRGQHKKINFYELFSSSSCSFEEIFFHDLSVSTLEDEAISINFNEQKVNLKSGKVADYDFLVIGTGSEINYFNIPGLYENSIPLKTLEDALLVRNFLDELFFNAPKNKMLKIIIAGGGFTGCEFAGELVGFLKKLSQIHNRSEFYFECSIVEGAPVLLSGGADFWAQKMAQKRLLNLGIKLILGNKIKEVQKEKVFLENNVIVDYDLLIWTGGVRGNTFSKNLENVRLERGSYIFTDSYLRISPYENVFGVGDSIYCINEKTGFPMPMTASMAMHEAECVAKNIELIIDKKQLLIYKPRFPGFIIPLGKKYALFQNKFFRISGFFSWVLKHLISLRYFISILGFRRGWRKWNSGLQIFTQND